MFSFALFGFSYVFSCFFTICRILSHCFFVAFLPVLIFVLSMRDNARRFHELHLDSFRRETVGTNRILFGCKQKHSCFAFRPCFFHMYFVLFTCKSLVREITK